MLVQAGVYVDRSNSGPYSNNTMQGGVCTLPPAGLQASALTLRIFVDRSILEVSTFAAKLLIVLFSLTSGVVL
jgi:hypothetical protein